MAQTFWSFLNTAEQHSRTKQNSLIKSIIGLLLDEGGKTIPELCSFSKLTVPTGTKFVNELIKQKILVEEGKRDSAGGRRPSVYALNPNMGYVVGVELLLHSFRVSIVNLHLDVVYEFETDSFDISNKTKAYDFLVKTVPDIIEKRSIPKNKILGIGIGITGRVDRKKGISYSYLNFETPLVDLLQQQWKYPVYIENDTHLMALGEKSFGHAKGKQDALCVNLGRGLGIGIVSNGMIHNGHSGFAGEFGHIHVADNDRLCVCGKKGCLETVVSGIALEDAFGTGADSKTRKKSYKQLLHLCNEGDKNIRRAITDMGEQLGKSLAALVDVLNPELIVIGGSFAAVGDYQKYSIIKGLSLHGLPQLVADCEVKVSELGDKAAILGAFAMVFDKMFKEESNGK